jgi:hypothetical protein
MFLPQNQNSAPSQQQQLQMRSPTALDRLVTSKVASTCSPLPHKLTATITPERLLRLRGHHNRGVSMGHLA